MTSNARHLPLIHGTEGLGAKRCRSDTPRSRSCRAEGLGRRGRRGSRESTEHRAGRLRSNCRQRGCLELDLVCSLVASLPTSYTHIKQSETMSPSLLISQTRVAGELPCVFCVKSSSNSSLPHIGHVVTAPHIVEYVYDLYLSRGSQSHGFEDRACYIGQSPQHIILRI